MAVTYDSLGLTIHHLDNVIKAADGLELRLSWSIDRERLVDDLLVCQMIPNSDGHPQADVTLEDPARNYVAVGAGATHRWTVEAPPAAAPEDAQLGVPSVVDGDIIGRYRPTGRFARIDATTGAVETTWPDDEYPIADRWVSPAEHIDGVWHAGDYVLLKANGVFYGYDETTGEQLWERDLSEFSWRVDVREDRVELWDEPTFGMKITVELDPATGEIPRLLGGPRDEVKHLLDE